MKKRNYHIAAFLLAITILLAGIAQAQDGVFDVRQYGAKGDGTSINTAAFQKAIDACAANGGGRVVVTPGTYLTGTVHLKSTIHLVVEAGAHILGSPNLNDYEIYVPGAPYPSVHKGIFFTEDAHDITVSGPGTIDGNSDVFFDTTQAKKIDSASRSYTRQRDNYRLVMHGIGDGPWVPRERPYQMLVFSRCSRITVRDVQIVRAPFWCLHFADCDAVQVEGIRLWNSLMVPNADGIDITSCTNVQVSNCDIRAGDDALVVTGYDHHFEIPGFSRLRHLSENIVINNCTLQSASSAIRIGWQDQNTVRNVSISNIVITNSTRGIGIFLRDEGSLEHLVFSNIRIETRLRTGDWWGNGEPIHISSIAGQNKNGLGHIKDVRFDNISCTGPNGLLVYGCDESPIEGLSFNHIYFNLEESELNDRAGGNIDLRGTGDIRYGLFSRDLPGFLLYKARDVSVNDVSLDWNGVRQPFFTHGLEAEDVEGLRVKDFRGSPSPAHPEAARVYVHGSSQVRVDDEKGVVRAGEKKGGKSTRKEQKIK